MLCSVATCFIDYSVPARSKLLKFTTDLWTVLWCTCIFAMVLKQQPFVWILNGSHLNLFYSSIHWCFCLYCMFCNCWLLNVSLLVFVTTFKVNLKTLTWSEICAVLVGVYWLVCEKETETVIWNPHDDTFSGWSHTAINLTST